MIGRDADLDWLRGLLETVRAGTPATAVIGGEAGIGKSRLLGEFTAGLGPDVRLVRGQCVDLGDVAAPYAPAPGLHRLPVKKPSPDARSTGHAATTTASAMATSSSGMHSANAVIAAPYTRSPSVDAAISARDG